MRILFWSEKFWPYIGGAEVIGTKLLLSLQERGHEFIVLTSHDSTDLPLEDKYKQIPVHRFPFWMALANGNIDHLAEVLQQVRKLKCSFAPNLIHLNGLGPTSVFFQLETAKTCSAPLLVTLHGEWPSLSNSLAERGLRSTDWVVGCSEATLDRARQFVPEIISHSSVIHNGMEIPPTSPSRLAFDAPRLLCLGRLDTAKGFDVALNSICLDG